MKTKMPTESCSSLVIKERCIIHRALTLGSKKQTYGVMWCICPADVSISMTIEFENIDRTV